MTSDTSAVPSPPAGSLDEVPARRMGSLVTDYVTLSRELGEEPDAELLGPIVAQFEKMQGEA